MCYKTDKHRAMASELFGKMEDVPKFISDYFFRFKSAASKKTYWAYIESLLQWFYEKRIISNPISEMTPHDLNKITSIDVINYLQSLQNGINCNSNRLSSLATKKNSYSAFWSYLVNQKYVEYNVVKDIPTSRFKSEVNNYEVKVPTEEQINTFLNKLEIGNSNEFDCVRNIAIVQLFLGSGIRSEELIGLDIEDLYLNNENPYIMILGKGKLEHKDKVYIATKAKLCLEEYLNKRDMFIKERDVVDEPALFLSNRSRRMSKNSITNFFNTYSDGEITPHMLRHWVGTELYRDTKDIVLVQRQLRHKSLEITAAYYVHTDENSIVSAVDRLGA